MELLSSKNESSADNWQERLGIAWWIAGLVDGEGTFSVSIFKNKTTSTGWQVFPEFVITQGESSRKSLEFVKRFFGVGNIFVNRRYDNHKENLLRYCVRSLTDLTEIIIPFFMHYQLKTRKKHDFEKFVECVELIKNKDHLTLSGLRKLMRLTQRMNRKARNYHF